MARRILVIGSGTGGTLTANLLARKLKAQIKREEVTIELLGEHELHVFQPANLDIAFKGAAPEKFTRPESALLRRGVKFVPDPAANIDLAERAVLTRGGRRLTYDYLVLATGSVASPELIPGLQAGGLYFHTGPHDAARIWKALQSFSGGKVIVAIGGITYKCPPSPNEAAFMLDEYFRRRGMRDKVEIKFLTPFPRPYPSAPIADVIGPLFEARGIEVITFFSMDYVDPSLRKLYSLEGDELSYDLLIAVPPHRGADVIRRSGIGDEEGWIPTDKRTLKVKGYDEAFAIGDATNIPISKSGVVAHLESDVVANNIAYELDGAHEWLEFNGRINCPMEVGYHKALFISATYSRQPVGQSPSTIKYLMKRAFTELYWPTMTGSLELPFQLYFADAFIRRSAS